MKKYLLIFVLSGFVLISCQKESKTENINNDQLMFDLLAQEDTDNDNKITIDDKGPKLFIWKQNKKIDTIKGTYHLSNFLQELAISETEDSLMLSRIKEPPTQRISRLIRTRFWDNLTRTIDKKGLKKILSDSKSDVDTFYLYIPSKDSMAYDYFNGIKDSMSELKVVKLKDDITPLYVKYLNQKPGILNLAYSTNENGDYVAEPFVVPGGRFNEMYGWDSYFISVGLLLDGRDSLAISMANNFAYQIENYGKILNANRSYYLTRTQPPFYSSLVREIYEKNPNVSRDWLSYSLSNIIKEYEKVWMTPNLRLSSNGLNRFYGEGIGIPPETEKGHFDYALEEFSEKYGYNKESLEKDYSSGKLNFDELDQYFKDDRAMRESGHDTSNRLDSIATQLNTVGLNSLLYKYEVDIAYLIKKVFDNDFKGQTSEDWLKKAEKRKVQMINLMWNEEESTFYDYNFKTKKQQKIHSATNFYPLWAGIASKTQAEAMKKTMLDELLFKGGIAGTENLANPSDKNAPQRQWDYPNGWAPHQMLIWRGLAQYGYEKEMQELVYRWLWTITKNAVNYNGTIPEKYDVVNATHKVYAEYGNVGTEFDYITPSGFGWMNASYQLGLSLLNENYREKLDQVVDPDKIF